MSDKAQRRLSSLLVVAIFVALQIPLKRLLAEQVPGKRGPRKDAAEAVSQGEERTFAVILASTFVRGMANQPRSGPDCTFRKDRGAEEAGLKVALDL